MCSRKITYINVLVMFLVPFFVFSCSQSEVDDSKISANNPSDFYDEHDQLVLSPSVSAPSVKLNENKLSTLVSATPPPTSLPTSVGPLSKTASTDLLMNLSFSETPLYSCYNPLAESEILLINPPYQNDAKPISSNIAYQYYPTWSPDGEWVAYIEINPQKIIETPGKDIITKEFYKSDSIWIMHPDGSEKIRVSDEFSRFEYHNAMRGCDYASGIVSFNGWSPDSEWVAYQYISNESELLISQIKSGETQSLKRDVIKSAWAKSHNTIAILSSEKIVEENNINRVNALSIFRIENQEIVSKSIELPSEFVASNTLFDIGWGQDDMYLYLIAYNEKTKPHYSIWKVEVAQGMLTFIGDLSENISEIIISEDIVFSCNTHQNNHEIEVRKIQSWTLLGMVNNVRDCYGFALVDNSASDSVIISYISESSELEVWTLVVSGNNLSSKILFSGKEIGVPNNLSIIHLSWKTNDAGK